MNLRRIFCVLELIILVFRVLCIKYVTKYIKFPFIWHTVRLCSLISVGVTGKSVKNQSYIFYMRVSNSSHHPLQYIPLARGAAKLWLVKGPWMQKSYPWIKVPSMEKMMDNLFICWCNPWMKSTDTFKLEIWAQSDQK